MSTLTLEDPPPQVSIGEPAGASREDVDAELLAMGYARLRVSLLMTIGVVLLFIGLMWQHFPLAPKLGWIAVLLGVAGARYVNWWLYTRADASARRQRRWTVVFSIGAMAAGASWSFGAVAMMPAAGRTESMLLTLTVLAVCSVAVSALTTQLRAMMGFHVAALLPTAAALWATGGTVERTAAMVVLAAMASLMIVGRRSNEATRSLLETQLKLARAIEQTKAARDAAQSASRAKSRFLANMSHELRTPLNAVIGAAQLMKTGEQDPDQRVNLVDAIERSGSHLLGLIENILDLSRIEAGELKFRTDDFHLVDCVEAALSTVALSVRGKGLRLACVVDADLPAWRHGDAARLRQVLLNLLGNAVKFTDEGEVVVRVGAGEGADDVCIRVSDTGVGIDARSMSQLFEPFRQADDGSGRRFGGSGLGLAIVRQLVEAMGGRIDVRSAPGQGSEFSVRLTLPAARAEVAEPTAWGERVAFFEPHEASAAALHSLLRRMGCDACRIADGQELRDWCIAGMGASGRSWLLVCTDSPGTAEMLEHNADLIDPRHVIGMSSVGFYDADLARQAFQLPRNLLKPVSRAALASRVVHGEGADAEAPGVGDAGMLTAAQVRALPHVLVVEDDQLNRTIVARMLQRLGCRVSMAHDGRSALAAIDGQQFDVVLMDWQMPGMDGIEVTRRLRAGESGAQGCTVPIIALTANAFAEDRDVCLAAGMNDFLTKPVLATALKSTVERWLRRSGRHEASAQRQAPGGTRPRDEPAVYDATVLATLLAESDGIEPDHADKVLGMYVDAMPDTVAAIDQALRGGDRSALQRVMHTLKSTSATVGAMALARLAEQAESQLRSGASPSDDLAHSVRAEFDRLQRALAGRGTA